MEKKYLKEHDTETKQSKNYFVFLLFNLRTGPAEGGGGLRGALKVLA